MNAQPPAPPPPPPPAAAPPPPPPPSVAAAPEVDYPVVLDIERQDQYSRFMPLVKWLLAIPHFFVLFFVYIGVFFAWIGAFFAVLITGKYPSGIFNFMVGSLRWTYRVNNYVLLMTDRYPPFSLDDDPEYPVHFGIEYPEDGRVSRWRPLFAWLVALPYLFVAAMLSYLQYAILIIAFFAILFTAQFPEGMFNINLIIQRWMARGSGYVLFMTTKYPPFVWG